MNPIFLVLSSAVIAALVSGAIQYFFWLAEKNKEEYETLYGPLRFHLLMMKIITKNNNEVSMQISKEIKNVEMRLNSINTHINPLVMKWLEHRDIIRTLLQTNSGYIRKCDLDLIEEFLDACLKREIAQEGRNNLATDERIDKIIDIVKKLQEKLL